MDLSRRDAVTARPGAPVAAEDPIIKLYWRFLKARAETQRLNRAADGFLTALGQHSEQYRGAQLPAGEAADREEAIMRELMATTPATAAGLLLLVAVLYDDQALFGDEPDARGFQNLIVAIRRLCAGEELAAAERLLGLDGVDVASGWPRALVTGGLQPAGDVAGAA